MLLDPGTLHFIWLQGGLLDLVFYATLYPSLKTKELLAMQCLRKIVRASHKYFGILLFHLNL